jgi:hypothetical protein
MGVRTVQRYERHLALPVRRPSGKDRASVVARASEIDDWINESPIRKHMRFQNSMETFAGEAAAVRANVAAMRMLRLQMIGLRQEVAASLSSLRSKLNCLCEVPVDQAPESQLLVLTLPEGPPGRIYRMLKPEVQRKVG